MAIGKWARTDAMKDGDAIFTFNGSAQVLKYYHSNGMLQWHVTARGVGERSNFAKNGKTPPGMYTLGEPQPISRSEDISRSMGLWFIPLLPFIAHKYEDNKRSDIGIHGGGTHLPNPLAPRQGWETTRGCIRVQNADLGMVASAVRNALEKGHVAWLTVNWYETVGGETLQVGW